MADDNSKKRVRDLLNLAKHGATIHERDTAQRQAEALMKRYNLTPADLESVKEPIPLFEDPLSYLRGNQAEVERLKREFEVKKQAVMGHVNTVKTKFNGIVSFFKKK